MGGAVVALLVANLTSPATVLLFAAAGGAGGWAAPWILAYLNWGYAAGERRYHQALE